MDELSGRVAIVTGASRGLGAALARGLAERGAAVALIARSENEIASGARAIETSGGRAVALSADLSDLSGIDSLVDDVTSCLGAPDILINNAATVDPLSPTAELDVQQTDAAFRLNVTALIGLTARVLPHLLEQSWGRIVNVSSGVVTRPEAMIGGTVYAASKAALEAHTLSLAAELDGTGVTVNAYRPGRIDTAMQEHLRTRDSRAFASAASFAELHTSGGLISAEASAAGLLQRLASDDNGTIWTVGA